MINTNAERIEVTAAMTLANARALLDKGNAHLSRPDNLFDLAQVKEVDSSGLSVIFGWVRAAAKQGRKVRIINPPHNLLSLAELYGVTDLLPLTKG
jgi:phospholipid transport system transporter-binding protein